MILSDNIASRSSSASVYGLKSLNKTRKESLPLLLLGGGMKSPLNSKKAKSDPSIVTPLQLGR